MKNSLLLILSALLSFISSYGQQFVFHSNSPFGIQMVKNGSVRPATNIFFFDYDFDGDQDLFLTGFDFVDQVDHPDWSNVHFFMEYQENTGDKWNPVFADRSTIFDAFPYPVGYFVPTPGDLNNDHITDFIVGAEIDFFGSQTLIQHLGNGSANDFTALRLDSAGLYSFVAESFYSPNLVDLDLDGDLDLMMSGFNPAFGEEDGADTANYYYAKNIGTKTSPSFLGWYSNPYGLMPNPFAEVLTSGDLDNDKDVDFVGTTMFVTSDSSAYIHVHLNNPEPGGRPFFDTNLQSPFGLPSDTGEVQFLSPNLVDLNGDGDLDFFVLEVNSDTSLIRYYENNLCTVENSEQFVLLCEGDAYHIGDDTYSDPGFYTIHLQGTDGCDSIIALTIELIQPTEHFITEFICEGETYVVGNESFNSSGNYMIFITAANGCDSIINLSLTVNENSTTNLNEVLCQGESFEIGNETFTATGNYSVNLDAFNGCDSIVNLSLVINPLDTTILNETICEGESYQVGQTEFSLPGDYVVVLSNQSGCDSTIFLSLVVNENPLTILNEILCEGESYQVGDQVFTEPGQYEVVLISLSGCDSTISLTLTITVVDPSLTVLEHTLTANQPGATYQWFDCGSGQNIPGATDQVFVASISGNYAVRITDQSGCSAVSECVSVVISSTEQDVLSNSITLYPNPANGLIQLRNTSPFPVSRMILYNSSGQMMGEFLMNENNTADVSSLGQGVYYVKIEIKGNEIIKKLVVL